MTELHHHLDRLEPELNSGCLLWPGATDRRGYPTASMGGVTRRLGREVFTVMVGPLGAGQQVCHRCDTPQCLNHHHLFAGDAKANADDRVAKRRCNTARGSRSANARLSEADVPEIFRLKAAAVPQTRIAQIMGVSQTTISQVLTRKVWAHAPKETAA